MSSTAFDLGQALALVLAALDILYTWWRTRDQDVESRFRAGSERMDRIDQRLASVEQALRGTATKDDMHGLRLGLAALEGDLREIRAMSAASAKHGERQDIVLTISTGPEMTDFHAFNTRHRRLPSSASWRRSRPVPPKCRSWTNGYCLWR